MKTPSPSKDLHVYLALEQSYRAAENLDEETYDMLGSMMDKIWYRLSDADQEFLRQRGIVAPLEFDSVVDDNGSCLCDGLGTVCRICLASLPLGVVWCDLPIVCDCETPDLQPCPDCGGG